MKVTGREKVKKNDSIYIIFQKSKTLGMVKISVVASGQGLQERLTTKDKQEAILEDEGAVLFLNCSGGLKLFAFIKTHRIKPEKSEYYLM